MAEWHNAGYFWLGLFIFIVGWVIIEHYGGREEWGILIGICFAFYILANIASWGS